MGPASVVSLCMSLHHRRLVRLLLVLGWVLASAPVAAAQEGDTQAPAGLSSVDEYLETVPAAGGDRTVGNGQRPRLDDPDVARAVTGALPAAAAASLRRSGQDGRDAAALAGRTAPASGRDTEGTAALPAPAEAKENPALAVAASLAPGGPGGLGLLFPALIVVGLLAVVTSAIRRRSGPEA